MQQIMDTACGCKAKTVLAPSSTLRHSAVFGASDESSIIELLRTFWILTIRMGTEKAVVGRTTPKQFLVWVTN